MLYRRLYFLFPDAGHARRVTRELNQAGVDEQHIHAVAREGVDLRALPAATVRQRQDAAGRIEAVAWNSNLALFAAAAVALLASLFLQSLWLAIGALVLMSATFLGGAWFALRLRARGSAPRVQPLWPWALSALTVLVGVVVWQFRPLAEGDPDPEALRSAVAVLFCVTVSIWSSIQLHAAKVALPTMFWPAASPVV